MSLHNFQYIFMHKSSLNLDLVRPRCINITDICHISESGRSGVCVWGGGVHQIILDKAVFEQLIATTCTGIKLFRSILDLD